MTLKIRLEWNNEQVFIQSLSVDTSGQPKQMKVVDHLDFKISCHFGILVFIYAKTLHEIGKNEIIFKIPL